MRKEERRTFLKGLFGTAAMGSVFGVSASGDTNDSSKTLSPTPCELPKEARVTGLDVFPVSPRSVFVKVETNMGITGWGEPSLEGHANTQVTAVKELGRYLIGKNPFEIERHWQAMYRGDFYRGGPVMTSAISGVDQALWDILGKSLKQPVHQLLGGRCRDKIRVYSRIGGGDEVSIRDSAQKVYGLGYRAAKMDPTGKSEILEGIDFIKKVYSRVKAARNAVPDEFDILLDFHGKLSPATAISVIDAITELRPFFVEEPIPPENVDQMAHVAGAVKVPIAAGERRYTKFGFRPMLEKKAVAVIQPDLCHAGGITEVKKIAGMAEAYYVAVAPHNPLHALSTAACLQIDASCPNFLIQEQGSLGEDLLEEPFRVQDSYIEVPTGPGLGVRIDEEKLARLRSSWKDWVTPRLWHEDGGVADW